MRWAKFDFVCQPGSHEPEQPTPGPLSESEETGNPQVPGPSSHGLSICFLSGGVQRWDVFLYVSPSRAGEGCSQATGRVAGLGSDSETSRAGFERQVNRSVRRGGLWERRLGLVLGNTYLTEPLRVPWAVVVAWGWPQRGIRGKSHLPGGQQHVLRGPRAELKGLCPFGNGRASPGKPEPPQQGASSVSEPTQAR